jgi:hypothetical protein
MAQAGNQEIENLAQSFFNCANAETFDFPPDFLCPITHHLILDPVFVNTGSLYERTAILNWLSEHDTNPEDGTRFTNSQLIPCRPVKSRIEAFKEAVRVLGDEATNCARFCSCDSSCAVACSASIK